MKRQYELRITCLSEEEKNKIAGKIYDALVDNIDYAEKRIVICTDMYYTIVLWFDCGVKVPESISWKNINKMFSEED